MIFNYDIVRFGWLEERRGKRNAPNQQRFLYYLEENLYKLCYELQGGTFQPSPLRIKQIYFPKRREAQVPTQEDKIVQHVISDTYAYYPLVAPLTVEASANTRGRGTDYAVERLQKDLRAFWLKYHRPPYIVKADIHSFFASIPHDRVLALLERYIDDPDVREIMRRFVALTDRGLPLGLQQSQLIANLYLCEMDHKIKERLGAEFYGRHMDDFYILCETRERAEMYMRWISGYVSSIGLELNPKTAVFCRSFDYLGFHFTVGDTGKIVVHVAKAKIKSKRHHLRRLVRQLSDGEITPERLEAAYFGWRHHALKAKNARPQVVNMDAYLDRMLRKIGYRLVIHKAENQYTKIKWRVTVAPNKGVTLCQEQSQT